MTKPYEPTPEERAAVEAMLARKKELPVAPRVKVSQRAGGVLELAFEHKDLKTADALLMGATGTVYGSFFDGLLRQLGNATAQDGKVSEGDLNFMLAVIKGIEPQDQVESMLAAGLCIHRPKVFEKGERKTEAYLYVLKSRFDELGYPCKLALDYDLKEGRFKSADYKMAYE